MKTHSCRLKSFNRKLSLGVIINNMAMFFWVVNISLRSPKFSEELNMAGSEHTEENITFSMGSQNPDSPPPLFNEGMKASRVGFICVFLGMENFNHFIKKIFMSHLQISKKTYF